MTQIFISYSRKDEAFARQLTTSLCLLGAEVWIDLEDIPLGVKWSTAIQEGLNASEVMIVILSPDSMASSNVEDEWQYFLDQKKPVVPVLYKPCNIHFQLNRMQRIHFTDRDYETAFTELHRELVERGFSFAKTPDQIPADHPIIPPASAAVQPRTSRLVVGGAVALVAFIAVIVLLLINYGQTIEQNSQATGTQYAAIALALSATSSDPISAATDTATPSSTPTETTQSTATDTQTLQPTDTPSPLPTATATNSPTPEPTATPTATDTATPEVTEAVSIITPTNVPSLILVYDENGVVLVNRSSRSISIASLLFVQRLDNGTTLSFDSSLWTDSARTVMLPGGYCAQVSKTGLRAPTLPAACRGRFAWAQVSERRWFWIGSTRGAIFEVRQTDDVIARCSIQAGQCSLQTGS